MAVQIEKCESELALRLNCAANNGDLHHLRLLIEGGAEINKTDYHGQSPLVMYILQLGRTGRLLWVID